MDGEAQQYLLTITAAKVGRKRAVVRTYVVCAKSSDEALAKFKEEMPAQIIDSDKVSVSPCGCCVMPAR